MAKDTDKFRIWHFDKKKFKLFDNESTNLNESIDGSAVNVNAPSGRVSVSEIVSGMKSLNSGSSFVSSDIYQVCLPKLKRGKTIVKRAQADESLITHVMFES